MFPRGKILPPLHDAAARPKSHWVCRLLHFPNMMRNILLILSLVAAAAWAADPLVGPGKVGEKDAKGHVKGADTGAGPHKHFKQQFERRGDKFVLKDHSTNGTYVTIGDEDEVLLQRDEIALRKKGWISFGQTRIGAHESVEFFCD